MYAGRIVEKAEKDAIFLEPRHPYTHALLASIPPLAGARPRRLASIGGAPPSLLRLPPGCAFAPRCPRAAAACVAPPALSGDPRHPAACFFPLAGAPAEALA
jgi:peptide/nickel transport system ATP-binding protein